MAATVADSDQSHGTVSWGPFAAVAVTVGIYFSSQIIAGLAFYLTLIVLGWDEGQITEWLAGTTAGQFLLFFTVEALTIGMLWLYLRKRKASFRTIGLKKPRLKDAGYALIGFGMYFLLYMGVLMVARLLIPGLDLEQEQEIGFEAVGRGVELVPVFIALVVLPPIVEEIVMRGFLYSGLRKRLPVIFAALITSLLFALAHLQFGSDAPLLWVAGIDTFVLSMVLIYLREKTGSLAAPILLHGIKNLLAFSVIFIFQL